MNEWILFLAAIPLFWLFFGWLRWRRSRDQKICDVFGLSSRKYQVLGTDLGDAENPYYLKADGLVGAPDAVFEGKHDIVVGEAKSRHFRGNPMRREIYQVILYMGMIQKEQKKPIRAVLAYGCGAKHKVEFNEELYRSLVSLIPKFRKVTSGWNDR